MHRRAFYFIMLGTKGFVIFAFCAQADEHVLSRRVCHRPQTMQRFASSPYWRSALRAARTSFIPFFIQFLRSAARDTCPWTFDARAKQGMRPLFADEARPCSIYGAAVLEVR